MVLVGCARPGPQAPERLAIVPFENLSASAESDWMRRALSGALTSDLAGSPTLFAQTVDSFNSAYAIQATRVLEGYFLERGGRLELRADVRDLRTGKVLESLDAGTSGAGAAAAANELAKQLSPNARSFPAGNETAFRAYGEALSNTDRSAVVRSLEAATGADPRFTLAFLDQAEFLLSAGDREGTLKAIESAKRSQPDTIDAAKLDYLAALAHADASAREKALESLTRLTPANAKVFRELGELELAQRKIPDAVRDYEAVSRLNPEDSQIWNELGYARAYAGDLAGARAALQNYQALLPANNVNPLDSFGEVSFYLGDFTGAEKYFLQADQKNRAEFGGVDLLKAAQARLLSGDLPGADALFQKYVALAEGNQRARAAYLGAQWDFLTGRRKQAIAGLERLIPTLQGDAQSLAFSQLSIWKLLTGDSKAAADLAVQAAEHAEGQQARNLSALCRIITHPEAPASASLLASAYTLLFARKYADALPMLEILYRQSNPSGDGQIRTLLAWAYIETNRAADAQRLVATYPIPLSSGEAAFASLLFPRYLFVRGAVLQLRGKRAEAKRTYELFLKFAGDVPDVFGDEDRARKNVSSL